ncbi:MAG: 50S ribosomal protein L7Ae [Candidatus Aenigmatarchaeota archaeon]
MANELPKEVVDKVLQLVEAAKNTGIVRKGTNEATKAIERGIAKLVVIAEDVEPKEIVMHLPALCDEKKAPYAFVPSKVELGRAVGLNVGSAAVAVVEVGDGKELFKEVSAKLAKPAE